MNADRSSIAIWRKNGEIEHIYVHWDGWLAGVGQTLQEFYNSEESAEAIVALGDISHLAGRPSISVEAPHSFGAPQEGVVIAYHRDRKDDWDAVRPQRSVGIRTWMSQREDVDRFYLWRNDRWWTATTGGEDPIPLEEALRRERDAKIAATTAKDATDTGDDDVS